MSEKSEFIPWHLVAQAASRSAFFEISDPHAPFMTDYELPNPLDYKKDKLNVLITQFAERKGEKATQLRHSLDKRELLLLCDQMSRGVKGVETGVKDEDGNPTYKPILQSYKGSPDRNYPQWEVTSRTMKVTYKKLRIGPSYQVELVHQEGKSEGKGAVTPSGNKNGLVKVSFPLTIIGGSNPPSALYIAHMVKNYLPARDAARMVLWGQSLKRLKLAAEKGDKESIKALREFNDGYGKKETRSDDDYDDRDREDDGDDDERD